MSDILTILTEYSEAITSIGVLTTLFGAVIGYFIRSRKDRKSGLKAENDNLKKENDNLKKENNNLKNQIQAIKDELKEYMAVDEIDNEIIPSPLGGDCLFWRTKNQYICPTCWYSNKKTTPVFDEDDTGYFCCKTCGQKGKFNPQTIKEVKSIMAHAFDSFYSN